MKSTYQEKVSVNDADIARIKVLFEEATKLKSDISTLYADALKLTFPTTNSFYDVDNATINSRDTSHFIYDDITIEVAESLANQMELSLTRAGDNWAGYDVSDPYDNYELSHEINEKVEEVFSHIHASNFQREVSAMYRDLIIGTAIIKVYVGKVEGKRQLIYKHYNLGRSCFLENALGKVDTFFYELPEYTVRQIESITGTKFSPEVIKKYSDPDGRLHKIKVLELCVPKADGNGYTYMFVDKGFETVFYKKDLNYQPFSVARYGKRNDISTWGVGKAIERLSLMRSIQHFAKTRLNVLDRDSRPAYMVTTSNNKQTELTIKPGAMLFSPVGTTITPLFTNVDLSQLSSDIEDLRAQLKQAFLVDGILEAQSANTYKTATEIQTANQKFIDKFATYASYIADELPRQIFEKTWHLLMDEGIVKKIKIPKSNPIKLYYNNPITISQKAKESDKMIQITKLAVGMIGQENLVAGMKNDRILPWLVEKLAGDKGLFNSPEETQKLREQIADAQASATGQDVASEQKMGVGEQTAQIDAQMAQQQQAPTMSAGEGMMDSEDLATNTQLG